MTLDDRVAQARTALADKVNRDVDQIELLQARNVTWRDGSIGCPEPGMMYTQALVPGYLIQLRVDGELYNYHGRDGGDPFLCESSGKDVLEQTITLD